MRHTTKTILIIMIALTIAGAAGLWFLFSLVNEASVELKTTLETIMIDEEVARDQKVLSQLLESTAEDRAVLESRVIEGESGTIVFLSEIDAFAAAENITLITSSLEAVPEARKPYDSLDITYAVSGSEVSIEKFILLLESIPYASEITQVSFVRSIDSVTGAREVNANISVRISMKNI